VKPGPLIDEPFGFLDIMAERKIFGALLELAERDSR
jgi:ABC-type nitrate/sulfonate/bicarbonate transport system ATPase subunit